MGGVLDKMARQDRDREYHEDEEDLDSYEEEDEEEEDLEYNDEDYDDSEEQEDENNEEEEGDEEMNNGMKQDINMRATRRDKLRRAESGHQKQQQQQQLLLSNTPPIDRELEKKCLESNTDYIALHSALKLLYAQREVARNHIRRLAVQKERSLDEPRLFLHDLLSENLDLPRPQHIVKCPLIDWQSYTPDEKLELMVNHGIVDNVVVKSTTVFSNANGIDRDGTFRDTLLRDNLPPVTTNYNRPVNRLEANHDSL